MDLKKLKRRMVEIDYKYKNNHLSAALSALPIVKDIYERIDLNKDVFILSKGHGSLALYVVLEELGFKPDVSKSHPDIDVKNGISCTTGSLGHGLPIAVGMALAKKIKGEEGQIHVLMSDGECAEGTTWESLLIINKLNLDNIRIHIDNNGYQAIDKTVFPDAVKRAKKMNDKVIIHITIKGQGISLYEKDSNYPDWHVHELSKEEYDEIMEELR